MLKQRVRDHIDPNRDLGHSDTHGKRIIPKAEAGGAEKSVVKQGESEEKGEETAKEAEVKRNPDGTICEDCR